MNDNTKTLKAIAIHALQALLTSDEEPLIKVIQEPLAGENIFSLTFGAPENKDSGDADEPYLTLLVQVETEGDGKFNCKIICGGLVNDPEEKTLSSKFRRESFKRKLRK